MLLKKSYVYRNSAHWGSTSHIDVEWAVSHKWTKTNGVELLFDMGTADKHEKLIVHIHKTDFATIASAMAEADWDAAVRAFSKALIQSKPSS